MIERRYFQPKAGRKYLNRNGSTYFCLAKGKKDCSAMFINVTSGFTLLAYGCHKNDDGTMEWDYSTEHGYHDIKSFLESYGFDGDMI